MTGAPAAPCLMPCASASCWPSMDKSPRFSSRAPRSRGVVSGPVHQKKNGAPRLANQSMVSSMAASAAWSPMRVFHAPLNMGLVGKVR